jgi:muramidase (phage lysozyme)
MNDRPFGFDTLTIPAVLVSDGDPASARTAAAAIGFDAVRLPAVLVPPGGPPPAGDYVMLGLMTRPLPARRAAAPSDARENSAEAAPLPQSRYRKNPGHPPTPGQGRDPLAVGIETWQGMAKQGRIARARDTGAPTTQKAPPPKVPVARPVDEAAKKRLKEARVRAFLKLIRSAENSSGGTSDDDYRKLIGTGSVESLDHFPDRPHKVTIKGKTTDASPAGAYQITRGTWQSAVEHLAREGIQINDFSVASQDTVAKWIIRESHAMDQVRSGDLDGAIARPRRQWVSLPGGSQPARGLTPAEARRRFESFVKEYRQ